jgi:hypothetical protein
MKHRKSKDILAANMKTIAKQMGIERADNSHEFAAKIGAPQKTVYNALNAATDPYKSLDHIAAKMRVQPWQLLYTDEDPLILRILMAYNNTTREGRKMLALAAETAERLAQDEGSENTKSTKNYLRLNSGT